MSTPSHKERRVTLLASLGSTLEYYDFVIYGMMAAYLGAVFFPSQDASLAALQSFSVFAVGYFARPLGGTLIGIIGDRLGRKPAFLLATSLMAGSTLAIAALPTYETAGILAVLLLITCRILQGLSFGAELPGAMTIVGEFSPAHQKGRRISLVIASTSLGALLASGVLYAATAFFSRQDMITWGWRLPFLLGGILGLCLIKARHTLQETPIFESFSQAAQNHNPLRTLLKAHKVGLFQSSALVTFMAAMIMANLYYPYYIPRFFGYEPKDVYLATTISLIFSALVLPLTGVIADLIPRKTVAIRGICLTYSFLSVPFLFLLSNGSFSCLVIFLIIQQLFMAAFSSAYLPLLIRLFAPEVRYTGLALSYNFTFALMATLPMGLTALFNLYPVPWILPLALSGIAWISMAATVSIPEDCPQDAALNGKGINQNDQQPGSKVQSS